MIRIRRASRHDAAAIGRVHVETWQATYAGLLPDSMLVAMSDVRQSAWWSQLLQDPAEARGVFVADDRDMGVVGFGSCGPVRDPPEGLPEGLDGRELKVGEVYTLYVEPDFQNLGLGRKLLGTLFRPDFARHSGLLMLIVAAVAVQFQGGILDMAMVALRRVAPLAPLCALSVALTALTCWLWIPVWGLQGAGAAMLVSRIVRVVILNILITRATRPATAAASADTGTAAPQPATHPPVATPVSAEVEQPTVTARPPDSAQPTAAAPPESDRNAA